MYIIDIIPISKKFIYQANFVKVFSLFYEEGVKIKLLSSPLRENTSDLAQENVFIILNFL